MNYFDRFPDNILSFSVQTLVVEIEINMVVSRTFSGRRFLIPYLLVAIFELFPFFLL